MQRFHIMLAAVLLCAPLLFACGQTVEIPPAHVGKLSTSSGLQEGIIQPSKMRLSNLCIVCDNLVLAEASDYAVKERMQIFIPRDKLNLKVDVRGTFAISSNQANVEKIFARIPADATPSDRVTKISMKKVYGTYANPVIREVVRAIITKYSIAEVMENRDAISTELAKAVRERLKATPITTIYFGLADVQPPDVIVKAQEAAKEREIQIQRAEADKLVKLKEAEAALEVAIKQQQVDLKEAETQVLVNQKLAEGVNRAFIAQRSLKILEQMAQSNNKIFFLPMEAMSNPSMILGPINQSLKK